MKLKDIITKDAGLIKGRDAIKIVKIETVNPRKMEVIGSVDSQLCNTKRNMSDDFFEMKFIFDDVIMFNVKFDEIEGILSDEEFNMYSESESESAIEEIENSRLVMMNNGKHGFNNLRHIIITAYDYIIEVVCGDFKTTLDIDSY
jgi:hypothetical protein